MAILGRGIPIPVIYIRAVNVWPFVDPASVPNLFCWYDANDTASFTLSGTDVTAWGDLSINARHLNLVTGTPSRTGTQNGLTTVLVAAGESVHRNQTSDLGAGACSIFAVVKIAAGVAGFVVTEGSSTDATHAFRPMESIVTSGNFQILERAGGTQTLDDDAVDITGAFKVLRTTDTGTSLIRAVDGVATGAAFSHTDLNPATDRFALGALIRGTSVFSGGTIEYAEVVAYNRALEPAEIATVEAYLTDKWIGAGATPLLVDDATHGHTAANVALIQHHVLTVQDATHGHTAATVALTQHHVVAVAAATHAHTAANVALVQHHVLTVANATHGHTVEAVALTQHHTLTVAAATSAHTAETVALVQHFVLSVADATHGHSAENVTLSVGVDLEVQDATHGHSAANVALTQHHLLAVQDAAHSHTVAAVAVVQHHVLTVADAVHGHSAANVVLEVAGTLAVQDATHGHTVATVAVVQHHVLVVADAGHAHTAANITLAVGVVTLVVADATHGHTVAAVALVQHQVLVVADATHAQSAGPVALTQRHVLAVDNAVHAHLAAVVIFNVLILVGPLTTVTVRHPRTTVLEAHARTTGTVRHPRTTEAP